ncbi:MAG: hypothetical protein ACYTG0_06695 [Planctomycetota bacterium]
MNTTCCDDENVAGLLATFSPKQTWAQWAIVEAAVLLDSAAKLLERADAKAMLSEIRKTFDRYPEPIDSIRATVALRPALNAPLCWGEELDDKVTGCSCRRAEVAALLIDDAAELLGYACGEEMLGTLRETVI